MESIKQEFIYFNFTLRIANFKFFIVCNMNIIYMYFIWGKGFKNGPSKIWGRQPLKNLMGYGLLQADNTSSDFLKAVLHKSYLVHSWTLCAVCVLRILIFLFVDIFLLIYRYYYRNYNEWYLNLIVNRYLTLSVLVGMSSTCRRNRFYRQITPPWSYKKP